MPDTIRIPVVEHQGELLVPWIAWALIFGTPLDEAERTFADGIPEEIAKHGRRRAQEAFAHLGDEDIWQAMSYWAAKDHGAAVEFVFNQAPA